MSDLSKAMAMAIAGSHLVELFDSGESSDEEEIDELQEQDLSTVAFNDDQFRQHFRVKRETFEMIICHLGPRVSNEFDEHSGRSTDDVAKQVMITLWMLATPDSYRCVQCAASGLVHFRTSREWFLGLGC